MTGGSMQYALPEPDTKRILLVNPSFPIPTKSKNHKDYLPIGLLKIASWLKDEGIKVDLVYGERETESEEVPDEIWITSLFTYWSEYVRRSAEHYRRMYQAARLVVGGIYATLKPEDCRKQTRCDFVSQGVHPIAEEYYPDYSLLNGEIDFQIVHASRGCVRRCKFCYTHVLEPAYEEKCSILPEIVKSEGKKIHLESIDGDNYSIERRGLVFYDNNFLANENIDELLNELIDLRRKRRILWCESQSGFDGRLLLERPELARLLKKANFRVPRIAWDWSYDQKDSIKNQIRALIRAKYSYKDIFVFMIYNWDISFLEMEDKRIQCFKWGVQISDCRYRPNDQLHDHYKPLRKGQSSREYYIHESNGWDDYLVKQFRQNVREHNICVRHDLDYYVKEFEQMKVSKDFIELVSSLTSKREKLNKLRGKGLHFWNPLRKRVPDGYDLKSAKPKQTRIADH
ncbi:MAG: Fe-S oxidoreductase [Candidatus Thorarchaeota archaeon]